MRSVLRLVVPKGMRSTIRCWFDKKWRYFKAPRMLWGFEDASGVWRSRTRISDTTVLYNPERIFIADNVFIGHYSILDGTDELILHEGVQLAGWNGLYTHSSHIAIRLYGAHYSEIPEAEKHGYRRGRIEIGKYSFVGAGAVILPGVSIGIGCVVAAGAVVNRNLGDFEIVSGNPAKVIGDTRKMDAKYLKDTQIKEWYEEWQKN